MKLEGKVALVTGSSRGVGKAVALGFAASGADVVINYTSNQNAADNVVTEVQSMGRSAVAVKADVAVKTDVERLVNTAAEKFGKLDILVNNAGFTRPAMMVKMSEDQWDQVVDIHLKGAFMCSQAAGRLMKEQNSGKIINVTSVAGIVGTVGQINYSAAKGGVISMTNAVLISIQAVSPVSMPAMFTLPLNASERLSSLITACADHGLNRRLDKCRACKPGPLYKRGTDEGNRQRDEGRDQSVDKEAAGLES